MVFLITFDVKVWLITGCIYVLMSMKVFIYCSERIDFWYLSLLFFATAAWLMMLNWCPSQLRWRAWSTANAFNSVIPEVLLGNLYEYILTVSFLSHSLVDDAELMPITAPLKGMEHCIGDFITDCDKNEDGSISKKEWEKCLKLDLGKRNSPLWLWYKNKAVPC